MFYIRPIENADVTNDFENVNNGLSIVPTGLWYFENDDSVYEVMYLFSFNLNSK